MTTAVAESNPGWDCVTQQAFCSGPDVLDRDSVSMMPVTTMSAAGLIGAGGGGGGGGGGERKSIPNTNPSDSFLNCVFRK